MLASNSQFETELKKRLAEEIDRLKVNLAQGLAVKSYDEYRHLVGQIFAFERVANEYCDEVQTAINKR